MMITDRDKCIYGKNVEIVLREDDCTVYRISEGTGDVVMTCYSVFPGIDIIYNDVHMEYCSIGKASLGNVLEINHCREGRIECEFRDEFCYLSEGDMAIARKDDAGHDSYFPIKHYHGVSIMIDIDRAPKCLSCILDDVIVQPAELIKKYCDGKQCYIMRAKPCLEHIFSELYSVPDSIKKGYFKVKILELLLFLSGMEPEADEEKHFYSKSQVALAKSICKYLTEHMDDRITLETLSSVFHVSGTHIKNCFKGVYGQSVYAYIRAEKMQAAAFLLCQTDDTVLSIAGRFGYDNGSKFASAFRDVMGVTPNGYRTEMNY